MATNCTYGQYNWTTQCDPVMDLVSQTIVNTPRDVAEENLMGLGGHGVAVERWSNIGYEVTIWSLAFENEMRSTPRDVRQREKTPRTDCEALFQMLEMSQHHHDGLFDAGNIHLHCIRGDVPGH